MFTTWKAARSAKQARRQYELARIEALIAENQRQIEARREPKECRLCATLGEGNGQAAECDVESDLPL